ncbi:MAG: DUF5348 domain-containing protein [Clostridia bacterium]|nr:DUF5348 domain-containing protein [Clostridia bacterium]
MYECMTDEVGHLPDESEDHFIREEAEWMMGKLMVVDREFRYLQRPTHGEYSLIQLPNKRYGYFAGNQTLREFSCGDCLEAKVCDQYGTHRWAETSIEHDGNRYYLVGFPNLPLEGLTIRERW